MQKSPSARALQAMDTYFHHGSPGDDEIEAFLFKKSCYGIPPGTTILSSSACDPNGPVKNLLSPTCQGFANFGDPAMQGHGGFPRYVTFDLKQPHTLSGIQMGAFVAAESPKHFTVEAADDLSVGPSAWTCVLDQTIDQPWGSDTFWSRAPWGSDAGNGGDCRAIQRWDFRITGPFSARFWRVSFLASFNEDCPTMHHISFYPVVPPAKADAASSVASAAMPAQFRSLAVAVTVGFAAVGLISVLKSVGP